METITLPVAIPIIATGVSTAAATTPA
uniref:Uncharacterized protein n=1 Tax=Amphimedon queenslandica TaxID=400682 RepID=A0A1X7UUH4_AMPQE